MCDSFLSLPFAVFPCCSLHVLCLSFADEAVALAVSSIGEDGAALPFVEPGLTTDGGTITFQSTANDPHVGGGHTAGFDGAAGAGLAPPVTGTAGLVAAPYGLGPAGALRARVVPGGRRPMAPGAIPRSRRVKNSRP